MQKKTFKMNGYNLHLCKTDKFKEITVKFIMTKKLKKEELTLNKITFNYLLEGSLKYPSFRQLNIESCNLYTPDISNISTKYSDKLINSITMSIIHPKYTEDDMLEKSLDFLREIIFNSNFKMKNVDEVQLKKVKKKLLQAAKRENENNAKKAIVATLKNSKEKYVSWPLKGYKKEIPEIKGEDVYKYYKDLLENDAKDIYVVGNIDFEQIKEYFEENYKLNSKEILEQTSLQNKSIKKEIKEVIKEKNINQSHLVLLYKFDDINKKERHFISRIYEYILSGSMLSRLFVNIREKNSLCYHVSARYLKDYNMMYVYAGIDKENFEKTKKLIIKEVENMVNGITEEELKEAIKSKKTQLEGTKDSIEQTILLDYYNYFDELGTIAEQKKAFEEVTKKEVIEFSKKIKLDNIYFLKGVANEKAQD